MTLQSSGAISMSQIKDEFGGTGSHALSEYHALAGLGVSGIPASGEISFSQFHGKSNQVTTSVWVSSGYNSSSWVSIGEIYVMASGWTYIVKLYNSSTWASVYIAGAQRTYNYSGSYYTYGGLRHYLGSLRLSSGNYRYHALLRKQYQTTWVDTSSYQNQTTTAQIST
jgi:hypothetical protein